MMLYQWMKYKEKKKMGCDIHVYTEARQSVNGNKVWVNVDNWRVNPYFGDDEYEKREYNIEAIYSDRNYELFSFLAGVRNYGHNPSFGFDRGLPEDMSPQTKKEADAWDCDGHTHGWCTLEELKAAIKDIAVVKREGAVTKEAAEKYRTTGETPDSWAQGVGCFVGIAPDYKDRFEWLQWEDEPCCFDRLIKAIEERKRDVFWIFDEKRDDYSKDKDIRIVFWFDN